jgi:hypothetical protein
MLGISKSNTVQRVPQRSGVIDDKSAGLLGLGPLSALAEIRFRSPSE